MIVWAGNVCLGGKSGELCFCIKLASTHFCVVGKAESCLQARPGSIPRTDFFIKINGAQQDVDVQCRVESRSSEVSEGGSERSEPRQRLTATLTPSHRCLVFGSYEPLPRRPPHDGPTYF